MTNEAKDLHLQPWQEVSGTCIKAVVVEAGIVIVLQANNKKYRLHLPQIQNKPENLQRQLIAVLKTESPERPFLIRRIEAATKTTMVRAAASMTVVASMPCGEPV